MHSFFLVYLITLSVFFVVGVRTPFVFRNLSTVTNLIAYVKQNESKKKNINVCCAHCDWIAIIISLEHRISRSFVHLLVDRPHFFSLSLDLYDVPMVVGDWWFSALLQFLELPSLVFLAHNAIFVSVEKIKSKPILPLCCAKTKCFCFHWSGMTWMCIW